MNNTEQAQQPTHTILFVDDEANILASLRRQMRGQGYRILTATSGAEGLDILAQENIDLVISDMRMPQMDGAAFLEQVATGWPDTVRILLTGYADIDSTIAAINKGNIYRYVAKPWEENDLKLAIRRALERQQLERETRRLHELTSRQNEELKQLNNNLETMVAAQTETIRLQLDDLVEAHANLQEGYATAIHIFGHLMELRSGAVAGHAQRVAELAKVIGQQLGLNEEALKDLDFAATLHDIGKIGFSDKLINKAYQSLGESERKLVERHSAVGETMLMAMQPLQAASRLIRHHHERHDGKGYPDRLRGEEIPLGARILAVANDFDGLQIGTLLGKCLNVLEARAYIEDHAGSRYDPEVVQTFLGVLKSLPAEAMNVTEVCMRVSSLRPAMVLSRDLVTADGIMLLAKGNVLDENFIERIQRFVRMTEQELHVYVCCDGHRAEDMATNAAIATAEPLDAA